MIPDAAFDLARRFEGLRLAPYRDGPGFPTVGYGHLLSRDRAKPLDTWPPIDEEEAERLLSQDLATAHRAVGRLLPVDLTEGQEAALIDFAFNLGAGHLEYSTLRRVILRGDLDEAPAQLARWVYAGPVKLAGLVRRRAAEAELFTGG